MNKEFSVEWITQPLWTLRPKILKKWKIHLRSTVTLHYRNELSFHLSMRWQPQLASGLGFRGFRSRCCTFMQKEWRVRGNV
eukprot:10430_3